MVSSVASALRVTNSSAVCSSQSLMRSCWVMAGIILAFSRVPHSHKIQVAERCCLRLGMLATLSGLPRVHHGHTCGLKVIHISRHNRHAVNKRGGRDESVAIGARTGDVELGAPLGNSGINRKDAALERRQNMAIHPGSKNGALFLVTAFDEEDSYLQFQD